MDETSIPKWLKAAPGNLCRRRMRRGGVRPTTNVSKSDHHTCVTLIATLSDDPAVQGALPQWILCNEATVRVPTVPLVNASLPNGVQLLRRKSAWNNQQVLAEYLDAVGTALTPWHATRQAIFVLDTAPQHLGEDVFAAAAKNNIWLLYVPPRTTWLLQPADTSCFLHFKRRLRTLQMQAAAQSEDGMISTQRWLTNIGSAVRSVIRGTKWRTAFEETGWCCQQKQLSGFVLKCLEWTVPPELEPGPPSTAELESCFPKGAKHGPGEILAQAGPVALPPPPAAPPALPRPVRRLSSKTSEAAIAWA